MDPDDTMEAVIEAYRAEGQTSRDVVSAAQGLDEPARRAPHLPFNLRFALVHMIEETAQHNGHLDLMREAIDRAIG